jgi:hypothetical protein
MTDKSQTTRCPECHIANGWHTSDCSKTGMAALPEQSKNTDPAYWIERYFEGKGLGPFTELADAARAACQVIVRQRTAIEDVRCEIERRIDALPDDAPQDVFLDTIYHPFLNMLDAAKNV